MVSVSYSTRLLIDYDFLKWVLTESKEKTNIITALLYTHNSSKENKKCQNVILKSDFDKLEKDGLIKDKDTIRGAMKIHSFSQEAQKVIDDEKISELIQKGLMGVIMADEPPCKVVILTTQNKRKEYEKEEFFQKIKDVTIKDELEGVLLINNFFKKFCMEKEYCRI